MRPSTEKLFAPKETFVWPTSGNLWERVSLCSVEGGFIPISIGRGFEIVQKVSLGSGRGRSLFSHHPEAHHEAPDFYPGNLPTRWGCPPTPRSGVDIQTPTRQAPLLSLPPVSMIFWGTSPLKTGRRADLWGIFTLVESSRSRTSPYFPPSVPLHRDLPLCSLLRIPLFFSVYLIYCSLSCLLLPYSRLPVYPTITSRILPHPPPSSPPPTPSLTIVTPRPAGQPPFSNTVLLVQTSHFSPIDAAGEKNVCCIGGCGARSASLFARQPRHGRWPGKGTLSCPLPRLLRLPPRAPCPLIPSPYTVCRTEMR